MLAIRLCSVVSESCQPGVGHADSDLPFCELPGAATSHMLCFLLPRAARKLKVWVYFMHLTAVAHFVSDALNFSHGVCLFVFFCFVCKMPELPFRERTDRGSREVTVLL